MFWRSGSMPDFGLLPRKNYPFRVYCLECEPPAGTLGPYFYVGIAPAGHVGPRVVDQFRGRGADYTKLFRPKVVHLVWPASCRAVESFVFYALLAVALASEVIVSSAVPLP